MDLRLYSESENQAEDASKSRTIQGKNHMTSLTLSFALDSATKLQETDKATSPENNLNDSKPED